MLTVQKAVRADDGVTGADPDVGARPPIGAKLLRGWLPELVAPTRAAAVVPLLIAVHYHAIAVPNSDDWAYDLVGLPSGFIIAIWEDPAHDDLHRDWARELAHALAGFGTGTDYVNLLSDGVSPDTVRAAYGSDRYDHLVALKRRMDPDNLFHLNQNIQP